MNTVFTYNQEEAAQIGGGTYVTKSGGYDFKVLSAKFVNSTNSHARALEMDLETRDGLKCNYVSINFVNGQGNANPYGNKLIQSIMGCTGVQVLNEDHQGNCPNLIGQFFKAVVQRIDYTKTGGAKAGEDGYKFEIKLPAHINTGKTVKETIDNAPATAFEKYASTIEDKDERTGGAQHQQYSAPHQQQAPQQAQPQYNEPDNPMDWDDEIPF